MGRLQTAWLQIERLQIGLRGVSLLAARGSAVARASAREGQRAAAAAGLFLRLVKFEHSVFALPFAYSGAFLAEGRIPGFWRMFWITVAMVAARSLAMALNRLLDAEIDALNPRTALRELPSGLLSRLAVWLFSLAALAVLVTATFHLPEITHYLWPIPVAAFLIYPLTKRWTWLCHLFLGATIGLGPVGAWVAVTGEVTWQPFVLGAAVALWIAGFDVIYACMDVPFDRDHNIHSLPADCGTGTALWATRVFHLMAVVLLALVGWIAGMNILYFIGVGVCSVLLAYENWLMRRSDLQKVGLAFMTMNSAISVVFLFSTLTAILLM